LKFELRNAIAQIAERPFTLSVTLRNKNIHNRRIINDEERAEAIEIRKAAAV